MELKLHNTLSRKIEPFLPANPPTVNLYTCGPTVYNFAHIGNLRTFIFEDVLRRTLEADGFQVDHVMNITDVGHLTSDADEGEDKLEKGAEREHKTVWEVAKEYTDAFLKDMRALNIEEPTHLVPATSEIDKQIEMIKLLEEKGFTYKTQHALYFDTSKLSDYGKLTGQRLEDKRTSRAEIVQDPDKKHQADFALWFFLVGRYEHHAMHWPSPWGEGFPGWHIECSAINWAAFPKGTDIHTGGIDHIPVHHTNEIAQYEAALDRPLAKYWLHGNFLVLSGKQEAETGKGSAENMKMAKSGENFITLQTVIDHGIDPSAYRYFVLGAHYRSELQFSWEALQASQNALQSLQNMVRDWDEPGSVDEGTVNKFMDAVNDDLNTPKALSAMWDVARSNLDTATKSATILQFDKVLGLQLTDYIGKQIEIPHDVQVLVQDREAARKANDFAKSDELRQQIQSKSYIIEDTQNGPKLTKK